MKQILFSWGALSIPSYGFFVGLAIVVAMALAEARTREKGLPRFAFLDLSILAALGGILGADLFHFAFAGGNLPGHGGRSFFGGLAGGTLAGLAYAAWRRLPLLVMLDCAFLYAPLAHAIGRIGCWFYGCCHGSICRPDFPLAVWFPRVDAGGGRLAGSPAFVRHLKQHLVPLDFSHALPVYPTQLLAALLLVGVFTALRTLSVRPAVASRPGSVFCLYLLLGGAARFAEEFVRDHTRYWGLLTNAQCVSLLLIAAGSAGLWYLRTRSPGAPELTSRKPGARKRAKPAVRAARP